MTTKARLFGEDAERDDDNEKNDASELDDADSFELVDYDEEDAVRLIAHLRNQLKVFKKAYQSQVLNTMRIVKKCRSLNLENKRLQAAV